jgi:tyrosyl-tRNA synthetase
LTIQRPEKYGGNITYKTYEEMEQAFAEKQLFPADLKQGTVDALNELLQPIRDKFKDPKLVKLTKEAYPEVKKEAAAPAPPKEPKEKSDEASGSSSEAASDKVISGDEVKKLDFRVGHIVSVQKHPSADSLYVEEIDIGEGKNRTVVSGLVKYMQPEDLQGKLVVLLCNLKPAALRGVTSEAMVLAASNADHTAVELLIPPPDSKPGDRVFVEQHEDVNPEPVLNPKKKIWETVQPDLKTNNSLIATYQGKALRTKSGEIKVASLIDANIK